MIYLKGNSSKSHIYQNCHLCQSILLDKRGADFLTCGNCSLMVRRGVSSSIEELYQSGWQSPLENLNLTGGTTPALAHNYTRELLRTLALKDLTGKKILDFGGGRGEMALALEAAGARVITVDPYSYVQLKEKGLAAVESLAELEGGEKFDGAIGIDVIEHLTTPWEELMIIKKLLSANGWLYLSTPNGRGLNARMNQGNWREALNPSHLLLFTPMSLEKILQKAGFENFQRLRWRVDYSESKIIQAKDWLLRVVNLDGVLRYLAYT